MKTYTDIEQSRKLAEILPLESADMHYCLEQRDVASGYEIGITPYIKAKKFIGKCNIIDIQPSWSLTALLDVLPSGYVIVKNYHSLYYVESRGHERSTNIFNNPVNACYEMIIRLHELNLL